MPDLTREEKHVLAGMRRLLTLFAACLPKLPADVEPCSTTLILQELKRMSDTFDDEMTKLRGDVAAQSTVIASATEAFRGLAAQLVAAEAAAKNAGATDAQVAGVTTLRQQLEANTASLAAAIPANTDTSAPTPAPTPTPTPADPAVPVAAPTDPAASPVTTSVPANPPASPSTPVAGTAPDAASLAANQAR